MRLLKYCDNAGFTLLEVIVTVVILAVVASIGLFVGADFYKSYVLASERDSLVSILRKARAGAMNNFLELPQGVFIDQDKFTIFKGLSYAGRNSQYDEIIFRFRAVDISGPAEVVFQPIRGTSGVSGTITLSDGVKNVAIEINDEGRISW